MTTINYLCLIIGIGAGLGIGVIVGYWSACVCTVSGRADDAQERMEANCKLMADLAPAIDNARFGLSQYPDAHDGCCVVEVPFTAGMCRALLGAFGVEV